MGKIDQSKVPRKTGSSRFHGSSARFHRARRATIAELTQLLDTLSRRIVRVLERRGFLIENPVDPYLESVLRWRLGGMFMDSFVFGVIGCKTAAYSVTTKFDSPLVTAFGDRGNQATSGEGSISICI